MEVILMDVFEKTWFVIDSHGNIYYITSEYVQGVEVILGGMYKLEIRFISSDNRINLLDLPKLYD